MLAAKHGGTITRSYWYSGCGKSNQNSDESSCTIGELKTLPAWAQYAKYYKIDFNKANSGFPILEWETSSTPSTSTLYYSNDSNASHSFTTRTSDGKYIAVKNTGSGNYTWVYLPAGTKIKGTYASNATNFTYYIRGTGTELGGGTTYAAVPTSETTTSYPIAVRVPMNCTLTFSNGYSTVKSLD